MAHAADAERAAEILFDGFAARAGLVASSLPHVKHEHTHHVAADADKVYAALADVRNLPHYVPQMTRAEPHDGDKVTVEARYDGHTQHGEGWFRPTTPSAGSSGAPRAAPTTAGCRSIPTRTARG